MTGRAARMGHRLTIAMNAWRATVTWAGDDPSTVDLEVDVDSLEVLRGEGGVTPMSGPEKAVARSNALKSLDAKRFPSISFRADDVREDCRRLPPHRNAGDSRQVPATDGGPAGGGLGDSWRMSTEVPVRQSDFGVKPYSLFLGSMKVADEVTVVFTATRTKGD